MSQYRYTLEDRLGQLLVSPLGESQFSIVWNKDDSDGRIGYKREFGGKITFINEAYQRLLKLEKTVYRCEFQDITIQRNCNGWTDWFKGRISLNSGDWDLDGCKVTLKFESDQPNKCIEDNKTKEVNLLSLIINNRKNVKVYPGTTEIETRDCQDFYNGNNGVEYIFCGTGSSSDEWLPYYHEHKFDGTVSEIKTQWVRLKMVLPCSEMPPVGWIFLIDECVSNDTRTYVRQANVYGCQYDDNDTIQGTWDFYYRMACSYFGQEESIDVFRNGMLLNEVLEKLVEQFCPDVTVKSDFFGINSTDNSGVNYVTGAKSKTLDLVLFQKSDIKRPESTMMATKANWTIEKLTIMLANAFNVRWDIVEDEFVIEHISFFDRDIGLDLRLPKYDKFTKGKRQYTYKQEDMPHKETWEWMDSRVYSDFNGKPIIYDNGCVAASSRGVEKVYVMEDTTSDVEMVVSNPDPDSSIVSDDGFVLIATGQEANGDYYILTEEGILFESSLNNTLGVSQLLRDYHKYDRPFKQGLMNNRITEFYTVKPTKQGMKLVIPLCCDDNFDPNDFINTFFGLGIVDKAEFNFKNDTLSLDLLYDSYSGLIQNAPPLVLDQVVRILQNDIAIIDITEGWTDPDPNASIMSATIISLPTNGVAVLRPDFTVKYTPNFDYIGNDSFKFSIKDNWNEESNVGIVSIIVSEPNVPPVANDDYYNTYENTILNILAADGVFENDTSSHGFTLLSFNPISNLGGDVLVRNDGSFRFTPLNGSTGIDSFTYTIVDGWGNESTATVFITFVDPDIPVAVNDAYSTIKNTTLNISASGAFQPGLLANDYTPSGVVPLTATTGTFSTTEGGSVIIESDGSFLYSPPNDFLGMDTFDYTVNNANGSDTGTVTINVMDTLFIKMSESDFNVEAIYENCDGVNRRSGRIMTKDIVLNFFKDAAGTIPYDITGLNVKIFTKFEQRTIPNGAWTSSDELFNASGGTEWIFENDFQYRYQNDDCDGNLTFFERRYIFENAPHYQMI